MKRKYLVWLLIILLLSGLLGCENADVAKRQAEDYKRNHPSAFQVNAFIRDLSSDNKTLLFSYGSPYHLIVATYNMTTGIVRVYNDVKTELPSTISRGV